MKKCEYCCNRTDFRTVEISLEFEYWGKSLVDKFRVKLKLSTVFCELYTKTVDKMLLRC